MDIHVDDLDLAEVPVPMLSRCRRLKVQGVM